MAKANINSKKGFTIIEVVLVLAIAGLIFLMVFVALPALQRSQRDTQRRDDMARFLSQVNQYQANQAGKVPVSISNGSATFDSGFITNYLQAGGDTFSDPSTGEVYTIDGTIVNCADQNNSCNGSTDVGDLATNDKDNRGIIHVYYNAKCDGENPIYINGDRKIAIRIKLEGAGIYCGNN